MNKYKTWFNNVYVMGSPHSSYCACTICNLKFVTLKRHTPDKFDQFLEDNIVTRKAICETLNDDNCYHCACIKIFTSLSDHLNFK